MLLLSPLEEVNNVRLTLLNKFCLARSSKYSNLSFSQHMRKPEGARAFEGRRIYRVVMASAT